MNKGAQYMLLSTFFFSLMNVCVKFLPHLPTMEVVLFRSIISLALTYGSLRYAKVSVWGNNKPLLISRGLTGAVALMLYFSTIQHIPLAGAVTLQYLTPIFTALLGVFITKEKVDPWQWLFFLISFGGVLIIEGVDTRIPWYYALMGAGGAFLTGISYNSVRKLSATEHPLVIIFYFPLISFPLAVISCLFDWQTPQGLDWLWLVSTGMLTQLGQYFVTKAYQAAKVAEVAILNYVGILYAVGLGLVVFGETFSFIAYLGMALVLTGVILNLLYNRKMSQRKVAQATV